MFYIEMPFSPSFKCGFCCLPPNVYSLSPITAKAQSVLLRAFSNLISIKREAYFSPRHAAMVRRTRSAVVTLRKYSSTSALPISTSGLE